MNCYGEARRFFFQNENDHECDFIEKEGTCITGAYQVCYEINEKNVEREITGLFMACKKFGLNVGYIITESALKRIKKDGVEIRIIPITGFLLGLSDQM
jgi:hypothetical protein